MILITEFMAEDQVARLVASQATDYQPGLADAQESIPARLGGVRALIVRNRTRVTAELLAAAPDLVCVGRLGVGLDNINLEACAARGVEVIPATGANTLSVVEYVITTAMVLRRRAYQMGARVRAGAWPRAEAAGAEFAGSTLGLIGFGAIGQAVAAKAQALGAIVVASDPALPEDHPAWGAVERLDKEALLARADVISLHVPLVAATRHLIDGAAIAAMKPGAALINTARGGVVDEAALAEALRSGQLGGAALDVFADEPLSAADAEVFAGCDTLILTPHIAGVTTEANARVSEMIATEVLARLG